MPLRNCKNQQLINEVIKNVPEKFKARISFGLGEIDSLFFFYNMIENKKITKTTSKHY